MDIAQLFSRTMLIFSISSILDSLFFIGVYSFARFFRIPIRRLTVGIGCLIFAACIIIGLLPVVEAQSLQSNEMLAKGSVLLGILAIFVTLYSFCEWTTRRWYVFIKKRTQSWLMCTARGLFLYMRAYHQWFGWIVFATSAAHGVFFVVLLFVLPADVPPSGVTGIITGLVAFGILTLLAALGLWIDHKVKHKQLSTKMRLFHFVTAFAFVISIVIHLFLR